MASTEDMECDGTTPTPPPPPPPPPPLPSTPPPFEIRRKVVRIEQRKWDITFLDNKLKTRTNPGVYEQAKHTGIKRCTPNKLTKWKIINLWHKYEETRGPQATLKRFRRKYRNKYSGAKSWINKISKFTWHRYCSEFKVDSEKFKKLEKYVKKTKEKISKKKKRFYRDPELEHCGVFPIFEEYLIKYRQLIATEYNWRSVAWMVKEAKRIRKNKKLFKLIKYLMSEQEKKCTRYLKCTRQYIHRIAKRHHLAVVSTTSDCKMSAADYISKRPEYLQREREFRRQIGVILARPDEYDEYHEEIWEDGVSEKWDGVRELNLDEVPFNLDMKSTKQIVGPDERPSVVRSKGMKYAGKYRQGTLVLVSNFEKIILCVVIFGQGGKRVAKWLECLSGSVADSNVFWECSDSGNMTKWIWRKTLNYLQNKTLDIRGCCKMDGSDWTKPIVLNVDNYIVHLEEGLADQYAAKYGIFCRCLIKNASHLQQPIDQHIGIFVKNHLKKKMERWVVDNERMQAVGSELVFSKQKWRQVVARFVQQVIQEIQEQENLHVLVLAWENYGLFLPLNGSKDGDINTLHKDADRAPSEKRKKRTQEYKNRVTIRTKIQFIGARIYDHINTHLYSMQEATQNSNIATTMPSLISPELKHDLNQTNKQLITKFNKQFNKDLSNPNNVLPDLDKLITPFDVLTLKKMYRKYKGKKATQKLMLKKLNLPIRDGQGKIRRIPKKMKLIDNDQELMDVEEEKEEHAAYNTPFVLQVLAFVGLQFQSNQNVQPTTNLLLNETDLYKMAHEEQLKVAKLLNILANEDLEDEFVTISGWSGFVPGGKVRQSMLNAANWARQWGGVIGETNVTYSAWHECWRRICQSTSALSQMSFSTQQQEKDLWVWLNQKLYEGKIKTVKIGGNSGLRCWFLSVLYFLLSEKKFMDCLKQNQTFSVGHRLLYNILVSMKLAIQQEKSVAIKKVTEFVEAFLQGHYCYWKDYGCLETAWKILQNMAPNVFNKFAVNFKIFSNCRKHQEYSAKQFNALRLEFNYRTNWDEETGYLSYKQPKLYQCYGLYNGRICSTNKKTRVCTVLNPARESFVIHFEHGMPQNLWDHIMGGNEIYFGTEVRQIGGAIFRISGENHFVAAILLINHNEKSRKPKVWYKFETLSAKIVKYKKPKPQDCRIIFVNPPETSCYCNKYNHLFMVQCSKCNRWLHNECVGLEADVKISDWDDSNCLICAKI